MASSSFSRKFVSFLVVPLFSFLFCAYAFALPAFADTDSGQTGAANALSVEAPEETTGQADAVEVDPAPISLSKAKITGLKAKTYNGKKQTQTPVVKVGTTTLKRNRDYTVSYKNNIKAGTATVVIKGKGNYTGKATKTFKIKKASLGKASASKISKKTYTGKAIKPKPKVKLGGKTLKAGNDYTLSYKNNKKAGTASIVIKGKGNYTGTKTIKFKIVKPKASKAKASSGGGGTVYITNTGAKYHRGSCRWLYASKIPIAKSDAIAQGYDACKVCTP